MTLRVSGKNMDVGDALRRKAEGHFDTVVKKYFDGGYTGHLTLEPEGSASTPSASMHLDPAPCCSPGLWRRRRVGLRDDDRHHREAAAPIQPQAEVAPRPRQWRERRRTPRQRSYYVLSSPDDADELPEDYSPPVIAETTSNLRTDERGRSGHGTRPSAGRCRHVPPCWTRWTKCGLPPRRRQHRLDRSGPEGQLRHTRSRDSPHMTGQVSYGTCRHPLRGVRLLFHGHQDQGRAAERLADKAGQLLTATRRGDLRDAGRSRGAGLDRARQRHRHAARQVRRAQGRHRRVFMRLEPPVEFESVDDQPVDLVMMLLAPIGGGADHLKALARVARILRTEACRRRAAPGRGPGADSTPSSRAGRRDHQGRLDAVPEMRKGRRSPGGPSLRRSGAG